MSRLRIGSWMGGIVMDKWQRIAELEAENAKLRKAAQAVVDGLFLPVKGDYHYSQQDTVLIDALNAALDGGDT
jgi:hypothetical protein